ncbi:cytochrome P450 family protein [Actinokineospora bangkokensis]|uniref:Cytochrome n=1 Tax=Actinokineospora bangkokensis TaxID=1193682 RepID=A0A1Q9LIP3_9PSEU|nr:cytochrome P450 [Actinokineospora bangkokensis]OLR91864.1 hypothetical protein BJP25_23805 [Actinokineospora bangkokensis]
MSGTRPGTPVLDEDFLQDPHAFYAATRATAPVVLVRIPRLHLTAYLVTRYEDVRAVLVHPHVSKDASGAATEPFTHHMLNRDPPAHTRLRAVVSSAFSARRVDELRPMIAAVATAAADALDADGEVDLVDGFAFPFALGVMRGVLGITEAEDPDFRRIAEVLFTEVSPNARAEPAARMTEYLVRLVRAKRRSPGDDLLTKLIRACEVDGSITTAELLSTVFLLLVAGHETTVSLIGNSVWALLRHPDQLRLLREHPTWLPDAIEELLRHAGPANLGTLRHTTGDVDIAGTRIPAGSFVMAALAAANRDPDRFPHAQDFDIRRRGARSLAFGHGVHHCLGAALARAEAEVALELLLSRFPRMGFARDPAGLRWRANTMIRGLVTLPVTLRPGPPATGNN